MASRDSEFELEQPKQDELYFPQAFQIENDGKVFAESSPDKDMSTSSQHSFGSTEDGFSIRIIEVLIHAPIIYQKLRKDKRS